MGNSLDTVYKNQSSIYKYFLYFIAVGCIVFFFPRGGKFKYEFQKGKPWQYENLYAPIDFTIKKSTEEIAAERQQIEQDQTDYFSYDQAVVDSVYSSFNSAYPEIFPRERYSGLMWQNLQKAGIEILDEFYTYGLLENTQDKQGKDQLYLVKNNEAITLNTSEIYSAVDSAKILEDLLKSKGLMRFNREYQQLFFDVLRPNVKYNDQLSNKALEEEFAKISLTRGSVDEGKLIIAKGEVVEGENLKILDSLKAEYESQLWTESNFLFILSGYAILVALVLMMLMLFLKKYRPEVFRNNVKVTFIFFNILLMVFITTLVVKYNEATLASGLELRE